MQCCWMPGGYFYPVSGCSCGHFPRPVEVSVSDTAAAGLGHAQCRRRAVTVRERRAPARGGRATRKRSGGVCGCGGPCTRNAPPGRRSAPLPPCPAAPAPASTATSPSSRPRAASTKSVRVRARGGRRRIAPSRARPACAGRGVPAPAWPGPALCEESPVGAAAVPAVPPGDPGKGSLA